METSAQLFEKRAKLVHDAREILNRATAEKRQPTADEQAHFDRIMDEADKTHTEAQRLHRLETSESDLTTSQGRRVTPANPDGTRTSPRDSTEYRKALASWLRNGEQGVTRDEYRAIQEVRALQADDGPAGGYLTLPQEMANELILFKKNLVFIRQLATTFTVTTAQSLGAPSLDADPADSAWTSELATGNEDSTMAFGKRELYPRPLAKRIKLSNKLLRMVPKVEAIVMDRLGYKFSVTEEQAFMTGTGAQQPLGMFTASANGISTGRDVAAASSTVVAADDFINTLFSLKQQYMDSKSLRWIINRVVMKAVRKLKDQNNQYLWQPSGLGSNLSEGRMDSLLNIPVLMSEYAPSTLTTGLYVAVLGDISYYYIADALNTTIQRLGELYAETNQTGFIGREEVDGMPVLEEAFARLKMA